MRNLRRVAIVGTGQTKHAAYFPRSTWQELVADATYEALRSTRDVAPFQVQAGVVAYHGEATIETGNLGPMVADALGMRWISFTPVSTACAGGQVGLYLGWNMIASGFHDLVLVLGFEKGGDLYDYIEAISVSTDTEYEYAFGFSHIDHLAWLEQLYVEKYKVDQNAIGQWVEQSHWYAKRTPKALHYSTPMISREEVVNGPLHLRVPNRAEGAAAMLLAPADRAHLYTDCPVYIDGMGYNCTSGYLGDRFDSENGYGLAEAESVMKAARTAYEMADVSPGDVDLVEVIDVTASMAIMQMEALGIFPIGQGWQHVLAGETSLEGRCPANTYGGSIGFGHASSASGLNGVIEAVTQLSGRAEVRQVKDAHTAVCQSVGGVYCTNTVFVLRGPDS